MHHLPVLKFLKKSIFLLLVTLLISCTPVQSKGITAGINPTATAEATPVQPSTATLAPLPTSAPTASPSPQPASLWLPDTLPEQLRASMPLPTGFTQAKDEATASVKLAFAVPPSSAATTAWVYALTAPFPTITDGVSLADLKTAWEDTPPASLGLKTLLVDASTHAIFEQLWGKSGRAVQILATDKILDAAWPNPETWAILPFEQLQPRWKVLTVDGISPIRKDFNQPAYGLTVTFSLSGDPAQVTALQAVLPKGNRLADHLTTVVVTGVTALVRGTASLMEGRGMTYPAQDIGDWLRDADILHISNEVAFAENCPQPFNWTDLRFCSRPKYIELLESIGTDVVELTGDHFADWSTEAMLYTLKMYKDRGWKYYGGGANAEEAMQPATFEHNGNRIAFIGCNAKQEGYATASATSPGAVHCNMDKMEASVKKLVKDGYAPIVTFQHIEYYQYIALPYLQVDFRRMANAGAVIVSGSQAHQPHGFEFRDNAIIHYGLGNLFFDQTNQGDPPRTAFIDRHVFYGGKLISTELLTIYLVDFARSRPMTPEERQAMLQTVFKASDWNVKQPNP
jgi:hypothetical protein